MVDEADRQAALRVLESLGVTPEALLGQVQLTSRSTPTFGDYIPLLLPNDSTRAAGQYRDALHTPIGYQSKDLVAEIALLDKACFICHLALCTLVVMSTGRTEGVAHVAGPSMRSGCAPTAGSGRGNSDTTCHVGVFRPK